MERSAADVRLDLVRGGRTGSVFYLLLNTFPMTQSEIQLLMQEEGAPGNRHIRQSLHDLGAACYVKKVNNIQRRPIVHCKYEEVELGQYNYNQIKYKMNLKFKKRATSHPKYIPTFQFVQDVIHNLHRDKSPDNYVSTYFPEVIAGEIWKRMKCDVNRPYVCANFRNQFKKVNVLTQLQVMAVEWVLEREYISDIYMSRRLLEERVYNNLSPPGERIMSGLNFNESQDAVWDNLDEDYEKAKNLQWKLEENKEDAKVALALHHFLPKDDLLQDIVELFAITYPALSKVSRQVLRRKVKGFLEE